WTARVNRILVVDDERSITFALRQYFLQQGYVVDCACTSEEAVELLAASQYHLAIVDVELRGNKDHSDGINLATYIRDQAPATAVIILSAVETAEARQRALSAGVHSYVPKPARLSQIADLAQSLINGDDT